MLTAKLLIALMALMPVSPSYDGIRLKDLPKPWQRLAYCESRNSLTAESPSGKHYGIFQIHKGFYITKGIKWEGSTLAAQWSVAQYVYARQGADAWSCAKQAGLK